MKQKQKTVSIILLIAILGLISLNIPVIALALIGDKAPTALVQDSDPMQKVDEKAVAVDAPSESAGAVPEKTTALNAKAVETAPYQAERAVAASRSSVSRHSCNLDSLAKVIYGEARGESFTGQVAIAAVVLNRVESGKFGNTVNEVIFEPGAFTAVSDGQYYLQPDQEAYKAAQAALDGWDPTHNAIYYWNPVTATNKWIWSRPVTITIGKHVFAH